MARSLLYSFNYHTIKRLKLAWINECTLMKLHHLLKLVAKSPSEYNNQFYKIESKTNQV